MSATAGAGGPYDTLGFAEQDGWAVFGELTFKLTDKLDLTVGLRQHDQSGDSYTLYPIPGVTAPKPATVDMVHSGGDPFAGTPIVPAWLARRWRPGAEKSVQLRQTDVTVRLEQTQFTDDLMGYVSYSEGFNSGGVSATTVANVRRFYPINPSTLTNYEVGMRSDWAGGRIRFNATLFHTVWDDIQAFGAVYDENGDQLPQLLTTNIGAANADGAEFELTFLPVESFMINVNLGLLDTAYTQLNPGQKSGFLDWTTETEFQQAPDTTYSIGLQHTATLQNGGQVVSRLDYNYQSQFWRSDPYIRLSAFDGVPTSEDESGDIGTVNLRLAYRPAQGNYDVALFGTNLTNEYMINSGFFFGNWGFDFATVSRPREAGVSLTFRF